MAHAPLLFMTIRWSNDGGFELVKHSFFRLPMKQRYHLTLARLYPILIRLSLVRRKSCNIFKNIDRSLKLLIPRLVAGIRPFRQLWPFSGQLCGNHRQSRAPDYVGHLNISPSGCPWTLNPSNITDGILTKIFDDHWQLKVLTPTSIVLHFESNLSMLPWLMD